MELTENMRRFLSAYTEKLIKAMEKDPTGWRDTPATAPALAEKMVIHLAKGTALISNVAKSAAKACGFKPTKSGFIEFLNSKA